MTTPGPAVRAGLDVDARRRTFRLSAVTAASAAFGAAGDDSLRMVPVNGIHAALLVGLAIVAFVGARLGSRVVVLGVGAVMIALGLIRLVTYGHGSGLITGGVGTAALLTGLGMAYIGSTLAGSKPAFRDS